MSTPSRWNKLETAQLELLKHFTKIEEIPMPEVGNTNEMILQDKLSQQICHDLVSRLVEELVEMDQEIRNLHNEYTGPKMIGIDSEKLATQSIEKINTELGDGICFLLELLLYSDLDEKQITTWVRTLLENAGITPSECLLENLFKFGNYSMATIELNNYVNNKQHYSTYLIPFTDDFMRGGRFIGSGYITDLEREIFIMIVDLNLAKNNLKNRPWKKSNPKSDIQEYKKFVLEALIRFIRMLIIMEHTPDSVVRIHQIVYNKNITRITNNA